MRRCTSWSNNTKLENPGPALPRYVRITFLFAFCFFICVRNSLELVATEARKVGVKKLLRYSLTVVFIRLDGN